MEFAEIKSSWPLLTSLQLLPLILSAVLWRLRGRPAIAVAIVGALTEMLLAITLYHGFDASSRLMQFAEHSRLLGFINYHVAADGMTVLFVLLTALFGLLGVFFIILRRLYNTPVMAVMAAIQASLMSQFVSLDLLWFVLTSGVEMMLVGYLLYRWATFIDAQPMITRYTQFMTVSFILLLIGTFMLGWNYADNTAGIWSFDLYRLDGKPIEPTVATLIFFSLFYGLGIRIPVFPFHGWLPIAMQHGNIAVAPVFLLGLKVGVFGLLRFVFPLVPESVTNWHKIAVIFAVTGVFYAALLAMRQNNIRRLLAYAVISHTSILVIGLFTLSRAGFEGSLMLSINFGLAVSGLIFMTGLVWLRTRTTSIQKLGGLFETIPWVGIAFLIAGLAIIGMPGTPGFDAVHFVLEASIVEFGALVTIAAALGNVVAAAFLLRAFQRAFLSKPEQNRQSWDTTPAKWSENLMAVIMILIILGIGFFSDPWLDLLEQPLDGLTQHFEGRAH